jgi:hypothetical protein
MNVTSDLRANSSSDRLCTSRRKIDSYKAVCSLSAKYAVASDGKQKRPVCKPVGASSKPLMRTLVLRARVSCMR